MELEPRQRFPLLANATAVETERVEPPQHLVALQAVVLADDLKPPLLAGQLGHGLLDLYHIRRGSGREISASFFNNRVVVVIFYVIYNLIIIYMV